MNTRIFSHAFSRITACLAVCLLPLHVGLAADAAPGALTGTLEKARASGTMVISYRLANVPFSYLDDSFLPTGYAKELCDRVVDTIRQEFAMPELKTVYLPVKADDRISALQKGVIDLECGSTSDTPEWRKLVDFSLPYFIAHIRLLVPKEAHIRDLNDLAHQTLVVTKGTTAEKLMREKLKRANPDIKLMEGKTHSDSFLIVEGGRAAAYATDDILLAGLIANLRHPDAYKIVGPPLSSESYAIMMRKGDAPLKAVVNRTLTRLMLSGEATKLHNRWFMTPIPPSGIIINLPMSAELHQIFTHPEEKH
ncbi:amino acid ABC transporter substrate-binding protein [Betaproteobacteria bacterium]|nr:amino acid ABC transporter substrate-binding protein [Betaproteobacteria bacterium]GHU41777.1 amino acid ABC transporter substrate-binding protein [Betaproteobacteria bacterium]